MFLKQSINLIVALNLPVIAFANTDPISDFVFLGGDLAADHIDLIRHEKIDGVQIIYSWRELEPEKGKYDFRAIEEDLALLEGENKLLFIQIQDRFFQATARNVPDYLLTEEEYAGGLARQYDNAGEGQPVGSGWVAKQWNPAVRARFQALLQELGATFDGRVFGMNLPESAIDLTEEQVASDGFSCDSYFSAQIENATVARSVFQQSHVVQYVNFWPCEWNDDQGYMTHTFETAIATGLGLGGPDIIPFRKGQMKNSYPFFNQHSADLSLIAMAIQEPTLTYTNPETGTPFSEAEFRNFAAEYLGVDIVFWSPATPWLQD